MFTCAVRRRLGTTWANGLWREALLRAPDLSLRDGRGVNPHPPARSHSQFYDRTRSMCNRRDRRVGCFE